MMNIVHHARMPFRPPDSPLPLTPISFEILLALLDGERHGYAILQAVEARLSSVLPLRTGTMYRALARLLDEGLIADGGGAGDERRRTYRITAQGRRIARAEAERLADQVAAARARRLLPGSRK
jgi:DNA-binding PadR family transcriptional regulator